MIDIYTAVCVAIGCIILGYALFMAIILWKDHKEIKRMVEFEIAMGKEAMNRAKAESTGDDDSDS